MLATQELTQLTSLWAPFVVHAAKWLRPGGRMAFVLPADVVPSTVNGLVELHRQELSRCAGRTIDAAEWRRGYQLALHDFVITRLSLYQLVHAFRPCAFLERVLNTARHLIRIEEGEESVRPALRPIAVRRAGGGAP